MRKLWRTGIGLLVIAGMAVSLTACTKPEPAVKASGIESVSYVAAAADLEKAAKMEGQIVSVGMPDSWANWKDTWEDLTGIYGLKHTDTAMSSSEGIAIFEAEKDKRAADISDVGIAFAPVAVEKGIVQPYKTTYWDEIPDWAKDKDGNWVVGYQGTIGFLVNKTLVKDVPKSWEDLAKGDYKIVVGDVTQAAQAQMSVLAAAMAMGGDESDIQPGIDFFRKLAKQKRISKAELSVANIEKGEIPVALLWDFNAIGYREQIDYEQFEVVIPSEGSVVSGNATIINKYAPHPNAAKLAREYILSDFGQINLARGYARPIRENVKLPDDVASKLIDSSEYKHAKPVGDYKVWDETSKKLPQLWQDQVLVHLD
ncbi:ABC transporter substrate-binding protein [Paenibacillus solisilvae]|uniref:ABC transporter substrate-binding protein n=1 Tax=Paenibacillus solisilvae TaxID=2486751 RepID=A0ABW0W1K7_9BACL